MAGRFLLFLTAILIGTVAADPQILILKNYQNGSTKAVSDVEDGANLYLASNDNSDYMKNIQVTTGGATHSLSEIVTPNSDGTPKKIMINGGLTITSTNADTITNTLTGYLYVTTAKQAQDPLFNVYVITGTHHVNLNGVSSTTVVLNTQLQTDSLDSDIPQKTTYVSGIQQENNSELFLQWGIPSATYNTEDVTNLFFSNPANVRNTNTLGYRKFFTNVEPLQVGLDYWYITSTGPISLTLQNKYVSSHNYTTTAVDTTGVIISSNKLYDDHVVNFQLDPTRGRTIGTLITPIITRQNKVSFIFVDASGKVNQQTFDNTNTGSVWMTDSLAAQKLIVNASDILPGVFYCQYYGFSTELIPTSTTQAPPVTQTPPATQPSSQTTATGQTPAAPGSSTPAAPSSGSTVTGATNAAPGSSTAAPSNSPSSTTVITTTRSSRSLLTTDVVMFFVVISALLF